MMTKSSLARAAALLAALLLVSIGAHAQRQMENLNRGVVGINQGNGSVFLGWRMLGTDPDNIAFNIYRSVNGGAPTKLNAAPIADVTHYVDKGAQLNQPTSYFVRPVTGGTEQTPGDEFKFPANAVAQPYLAVPIEPPANGKTPPSEKHPEGEEYSYHANDCSVGDLDGDREYEIVVKWDPSNAHDNSHAGYTGNVFLDAYKMNGTRLWRIDLGRNIRAGAHYTQFMVYDLDGDGKAEVACKTADATVDGKGKVIGDANADHRNKGGYILAGPEFLTVFDGQTGAELATTKYIPPRHPDTETPTGDQIKAVWGDNYGNRVDRFLACVAYLDGSRPSLVMCRGYYTRTVLAAWDWRDGKLTKRWVFDSNEGGEKNKKFAGQGNHNLSVADVDGDSKDEIVYGGMCVDDDGKGLWTTGIGHGDAMHVTDHDPDHQGLEVFRIQEPFGDAGAHMLDAKTGEVLWKKPSVSAGSDKEGPGRGLALDLDPRTKGSESWVAGAGIKGLFDAKGNVISEKNPGSCNFAVWWDGDLLREILDKTWIGKWNWETQGLDRVLTVEGCGSNNGTKATPCLSADILGDWREEVIWRTSDTKELRIYTTTIPTKHRIYTLMHDPQYRLSIAWQNVSYNQPPHTGFYLADGMDKPPKPNIAISGGGAKRQTAVALAPSASQLAAQDRLRALLAARQQESEATKRRAAEIKKESKQLVVVRSLEGQPRLFRVNSLTTDANIVTADFGGGKTGLWEKKLVVAQLPWHSPAELESDAVDLPQLVSRYEATVKAYPEIRASLEPELAQFRAIESKRQQHRAQLEAAIASLRYEAAKDYTPDELNQVFAKANQWQTELPEKQAEIDAKLAPFRQHAENLLAGKVFVQGTWRTRDEIKRDAFVQSFPERLEPVVTTKSHVMNAVKVPGLGTAGVAVLGVILALRKRTRTIGLLLLILSVGGALWYLYALGGGSAPSPATADRDGSGAEKVVSTLLAGTRGADPSQPSVTLTESDVNDFLAKYVKYPEPPPNSEDIYRTGLSVELPPNEVVIREQLRWANKAYQVRYDLKLDNSASQPRVTSYSVTVGQAPAPGRVKDLLWASLSSQIEKLVQPAGNVKLSRASKGELVLAAADISPPSTH